MEQKKEIRMRRTRKGNYLFDDKKGNYKYQTKKSN